MANFTRAITVLKAIWRRHPADEQCWLLLGNQNFWTAQYCRGKRVGIHRTTGLVSFDWQAVYDRQDTQGDVAGFFHTHPYRAGVHPSAQDIETMYAWANALGKPLVCVIHDGRWKAAWLFEPGRTGYKRLAYDMADYPWRFS